MNEMIKIKRDTIIRPGDVLTSANGNEKLQVKAMSGMKVNLVNPITKSEKLINKYDLILNNWTLEIGNGRGYW